MDVKSPHGKEIRVALEQFVLDGFSFRAGFFTFFFIVLRQLVFFHKRLQVSQVTQVSKVAQVSRTCLYLLTSWGPMGFVLDDVVV